MVEIELIRQSLWLCFIFSSNNASTVKVNKNNYDLLKSYEVKVNSTTTTKKVD